MKLFGHPLHMMLVHFPSALLPMDLACSAIAWYGGPDPLVAAAFYAMMGGVLLGWLAVATGTADLLSVSRNQPQAMKKVLVHGGINSLVLLVYSLLALLAWKRYPAFEADPPAILFLKLLLVLVLFTGNFVGGSLVLKDRVGSGNKF